MVYIILNYDDVLISSPQHPEIFFNTYCMIKRTLYAIMLLTAAIITACKPTIKQASLTGDWKYIKIDKEVFLIGKHFSKVYNLYKKNYNSEEVFEIKDEDYLNQIIDLHVYFDNENANFIKKILTETTNLDKCMENIKTLINKIRFLCDNKN